MLLTSRVLEGLFEVLKIAKLLKIQNNNNTEFTSKWRDIVGWNTLNQRFQPSRSLLPFQTCPTLSVFLTKISDRLKLLIENLPRLLPVKTAAESAFATFLVYRIDPELLELTGCEVSHQFVGTRQHKLLST